jgi:hypothetical protein
MSGSKALFGVRRRRNRPFQALHSQSVAFSSCRQATSGRVVLEEICYPLVDVSDVEDTDFHFRGVKKNGSMIVIWRG